MDVGGNDEWSKPGREFGVGGRFASVPAYQIATDVRGQTLALVGEVATMSAARPPLPDHIVSEAERVSLAYRHRVQDLHGSVEEIVLDLVKIYDDLCVDRQRLRERKAAARMIA